MPRAARERYLWLGLALAALLPRALGASLRPPWHDEYFTVWAAGLPLKGLLAALRLDSGPPLPYLLVKLITILGVPALAAARALAVGTGTAAVLLAARASRRTFGAEAGWWTGALLALHPLAVAWSSEGRAYALLLLAGAWVWDRLGALEHGGGGGVGLALAVALACWCHGLGLILATVAAAVGLTLPRPQRWRALAAVAAGLASLLPWLPVAAHQPPAAIAWMAAFWSAVSPLPRLAAAVRLLSPVGSFGAFLDLPSAPVWAEAGGAGLVVVLMAAACRRWSAARRPLFGVLLAVGALTALTAAGVPVFYPGRGEALVLVPFALLLGGAAAGSRPLRAGALILTAAAAAVSTAAIAGWAGRPESPEQLLATELRQRLPAGGEVVIGGYWRLGIAFHLGRERECFHLVNYPAEAALHPGWYDAGSDTPAPGELDRLLATLRLRAAQTGVVVTPGLATASQLERLAMALGLRPVLSVTGGRLLAAGDPPID